MQHLIIKLKAIAKRFINSLVIYLMYVDITGIYGDKTSKRAYKINAYKECGFVENQDSVSVKSDKLPHT